LGRIGRYEEVDEQNLGTFVPKRTVRHTRDRLKGGRGGVSRTPTKGS